MTHKRIVFSLLFILILLFILLGYVLHFTEVVNISNWVPFLRQENPAVIDDQNYPTEIDKLEHLKQKEKLIEQEEKLATKEVLLKEWEDKLNQSRQEIEEMRRGLQEERKKLALLAKDWQDRKKKIKDLAIKVRNMPPEKAVEMMQRWKHFDIIDVIRQIDQDTRLEDAPSITPYLLTLFTPEERAEITRKMLLPPLLESDEDPTE